jgi:DNA-binding MarR family transcriptional regulator
MLDWRVIMEALREFLGIRRVVALWESRVDAQLGAVHGLGVSELAALHYIANAHGGRARRVDIARALALTPSGVTRLLGPLERRGILTREEDGNDARATFSVLTRSGKSLVRDATETATSIAESILGSLGPKEHAAFARIAELGDG